MNAANTPPGTVMLGRSALRVSRLGLGTWAWGDKRFWQYAEAGFPGPREVVDAFAASVDAGIDFLDTAEVYGHGESEKIVGWLARKSGRPLVLATKFAPLPERGGVETVARAVDTSLRRMGVPVLDLYQVHWCDAAWAPVESVMDALAVHVKAGRIRAVGVSNYSAQELRQAHAALARHGIPLATQQVQYSLLHRAPEVDGVRDTCRELGITLLAYSPLAQGILTGSYTPGRPVPPGPRGSQAQFAPEALHAAQPLVARLQEIGARHGGANPGAVALAWLMAQTEVVPLAGARTGAQATANARALSLTLTADEVDALTHASEPWRRAVATDD